MLAYSLLETLRSRACSARELAQIHGVGMDDVWMALVRLNDIQAARPRSRFSRLGGARERLWDAT